MSVESKVQAFLAHADKMVAEGKLDEMCDHHLVDDCTYLGPFAPAVKGKEGVKAAMKKMGEFLKHFNTKTTAEAVVDLGDHVVVHWHGDMKNKGENPDFKKDIGMKGLFLAKKHGDTFKIMYECMNSDQFPEIPKKAQPQ